MVKEDSHHIADVARSMMHVTTKSIRTSCVDFHGISTPNRTIWKDALDVVWNTSQDLS